jgi:hypothetical protein
MRGPEIDRGRIFFTSQGKALHCLDPNAGLRIDQRDGETTTCWIGSYRHAPMDKVTGNPVAIHYFPADQNELHELQTTLEKTRRLTGIDPDFVTTDKASSFDKCFDYCARRGITLTTPYRPSNQFGAQRAEATLYCDIHGVPLCTHCGGGTDQLDFLLRAGGRPVHRVRCSMPTTPGCKRIQEVSLLKAPTRMTPVWHTHAAYCEARTGHESGEHSHADARSRGGSVAAKGFGERQRRVSLALSQLRGTAQAINGWIRTCVINGWAGTAPLNPNMTDIARRRKKQERQAVTDTILERTFEARRRRGLVGGGHVAKRPKSRARGTPPRAARAGP